MNNQTPTPSSPVAPTRRRTLPSAVGEPMIWLTGGALVACVVMIVLLISLVVVNGSKSFWPRGIEQVTLDSGEVFLGVVTDRELIESTFDTEETSRTLYQVGNRDLGQASYRWVDTKTIDQIDLPEHAVMLEREAWGVWFGVPESIVRTSKGQEIESLAEGAQETLDGYEAMHRESRASSVRVEEIKANELGAINRELSQIRLAIRQEEINTHRDADGLFRFGWIGWLIVGVGCDCLWRIALSYP